MKDFNKLFTGLKDEKVISEKEISALKSRVLIAVRLEEERMARRKTVIFSIGTVFSFGLAVFFSISLVNAFMQSGFYEYFSLLFTGDGAVYSLWKELTLALLDSMPVLGLILLLITTGFFIWTGAKALSSAKRLNSGSGLHRNLQFN